jgi:hypothetical protein
MSSRAHAGHMHSRACTPFRTHQHKVPNVVVGQTLQPCHNRQRGDAVVMGARGITATELPERRLGRIEHFYVRSIGFRE